MALILRLLVRVPLRQRNIRSMELGRNLYQDQGEWHLSFTGEELKIGHRRGRPNAFNVNLSTHCPDLIPHLDEYLQIFRPRHIHADVSRYVFLTQQGRAYPDGTIASELKAHVYHYTQRRFYPHLIRTIWTTECIRKTRNYALAARMLNDDVHTVWINYHELIEEDYDQQASDFVKQSLGV
jgi:hypothetical protein